MEFSSVNCRSVQADWSEGPVDPQVLNSCHVWAVRVSHSISALDRLQSILIPEERAKSQRFHFSRDRNSYIVRRASLRLLLGRYMGVDPVAIGFTTAINKRPVLEPAQRPGPCFNVSHSGDMILIAISDCDIGVDIEEVVPGFSYTEIMEASFSNQEITCVGKAESPVSAFYQIWTRKEALLKACSKGITENLADFQCLDGTQSIPKDLLADSWFISSFRVNGSYAGSIASAANYTPVYYELSFQDR